jgi:hypothetical protein
MHAAFKEWAIICDALGKGLQSVILRKGGIAEGKTGFAFRHDEFLLFPSWFHEQLERTTLPPDTLIPEEPGEELELRYTAHIEWSGLIADRQKLAHLRELMFSARTWSKNAINIARRKEFMWPLFVYRLEPPVRLKNEKKYGGCRSWMICRRWKVAC